jgi:hypothetical protein
VRWFVEGSIERGGRRFVNIAIPGGFKGSRGALKLVLEGF